MSRSRKTRRTTTDRSATDRSATVDIVTQLEIAARNPHAAAIGAVIGGLVPSFGRTLAHSEIPTAWTAGHHNLALAMGVVALGCAAFSGRSVYKFGQAAFRDKSKALGFVLALEGVMLVAQGLTSAVALGLLILINAVSNGSVIALARDATRKQQDSMARGAATRARSRSAGKSSPSPAPHQPSSTPQDMVVGPRWKLTDTLDAEIVSETLLS